MKWAFAAWFAMVGCAGSKDTDTDTDGVTDTDTVTDTGSVTDGPVLESVSVRLPDEARVHLVNLLDVTTDVPTQVEVRLTDPDGGVRELPVTPALATEHTVTLLGLHFDTTYTIDLTLTDGDGEVTVVDAAASTLPESPPAMWPDMEVITSEPASMEPGHTLFAINAYRQVPGSANYLAVMDADGEVVWYFEAGAVALDAHLDAAGNLLTVIGAAIVELDWLGNELARYAGNTATTGTYLPVQSLHHEAYEMPSGNILSLTKRDTFSPTYPLSYTDPFATAPQAVLSHDIVEFDRAGNIVVEIELWDLLDHDRIGYDSLLEEPKDWVHSNAALYDASDDSYIVSLRHQEALIKVSRATGELVWILGNPHNWSAELQPKLLTAEPGTAFTYHQHGPMLSPEGRILVFDNGNNRVMPFDGQVVPPITEQYSRLVEFEVDEVAMTVRQTWEFVAPGSDVLFSYATGDADYLPSTGNVLGTYGFTHVVNGVENVDLGRGFGSSRVIEVNQASNEVVFDVLLSSDVAELPDGWHGYRATRIPAWD